MPAPSTWAKRLADDLVEVGQTFGFIAVKEEPPVSSSAMKIDVVWKIQFDKEIEKIIPHETVIVSIEIQYSKSDASISHGLEILLHKFSVSYHSIRLSL